MSLGILHNILPLRNEENWASMDRLSICKIILILWRTRNTSRNSWPKLESETQQLWRTTRWWSEWLSAVLVRRPHRPSCRCVVDRVWPVWPVWLSCSEGSPFWHSDRVKINRLIYLCIILYYGERKRRQATSITADSSGYRTTRVRWNLFT